MGFVDFSRNAFGGVARGTAILGLVLALSACQDGTNKFNLFKKKEGAEETAAPLVILKSGFEQSIYRFAHQNSMLYGIFAVLLAVVTGWLGRIVFKRD